MVGCGLGSTFGMRVPTLEEMAANASAYPHALALEAQAHPGRELVVDWHMPKSLKAEIILVLVALCIFVYRFFGKNEWLKTHGVILVSYYALGGLIYDEVENWSLMETTYFLTVTITTVGYGDLCPESPEGKLFTVFYSLIGIIFVFAALQPLVDALLWFKDKLLAPITPLEPQDTDDYGQVRSPTPDWSALSTPVERLAPPAAHERRTHPWDTRASPNSCPATPSSTAARH